MIFTVESQSLLTPELESMIEIIKTYSEVERLILFGSSAQNSVAPARDIDLLLIVENSVIDLDALTLKIRKSAFHLVNLPIDILTETRDTFELRKNLPTL